jgi:hypothetical protein
MFVSLKIVQRIAALNSCPLLYAAASYVLENCRRCRRHRSADLAAILAKSTQ